MGDWFIFNNTNNKHYSNIRHLNTENDAIILKGNNIANYKNRKT